MLFLIAQPRYSTSGKPSVHIRHFHGSKNEQILIFQNRFQLIVNTHSRNAFVRLQEIASWHKQQRLTNFVELPSKLFHPCRILYVKIHNIEHIKHTQSLSPSLALFPKPYKFPRKNLPFHPQNDIFRQGTRRHHHLILSHTTPPQPITHIVVCFLALYHNLNILKSRC